MGQTISSSNFFFYGKKHFTHKGYVRHVKNYTEPVQSSALALDGKKDGVNLDGRVVVITGANSGLGKEVATYSAAKGAKVYMLCRTKSKAEAARDEIIKATGNDKVEVLLVDVSELEQIRTVAKEIQSKEHKIHALVCNAGVLVKEKMMTTEGYEATFASHLLGGSYLLSKLLIPLVKADEEGRIIFTTSGKSAYPSFFASNKYTGLTSLHRRDVQFPFAGMAHSERHGREVEIRRDKRIRLCQAWAGAPGRAME